MVAFFAGVFNDHAFHLQGQSVEIPRETLVVARTQIHLIIIGGEDLVHAQHATVVGLPQEPPCYLQRLHAPFEELCKRALKDFLEAFFELAEASHHSIPEVICSISSILAGKRAASINPRMNDKAVIKAPRLKSPVKACYKLT